MSCDEKGSVHKGCPHFRGGRGIATMQTKADMGRDGHSHNGHSFQCSQFKRGEGI